MTSVYYYFLYFITWLFSLLPFKIMYLLSDLLYFFAFYIPGYRKKTVTENMKRVFPDKSNDEIMSLAKKFYHHFCDFVLESMKIISMSPSVVNKRYIYKDLEVFNQLIKDHKSIALVSAHYGNWEWSVNLPSKIKHTPLVIYRPLKNKAVDRLSKKIRTRMGLKLIAMEKVYRQALIYQEKKAPYLVWFLADQRPPASNKFRTLFLGQEASFFQGYEKMARKLDLAVVYMCINKLKRGYYEVSFKKLFHNASVTTDNEISLTCIQEIEQSIYNKPEYWLWTHKRFKHTKPEDINLITL